MPTMVNKSSTKNIWWICKNGHEWQYVVDERYKDGKKAGNCKICESIGFNYPELAAQISDKNKISKLMNESDYLISVSKIETFGITIAEAISSGLPAIVIDSGGPNDFINQTNSYKVSNFKDLKKIITKNIFKKKIFNRKKMHLQIKSKFNIKKISELYDKEFKKIYENFDY